MRVCLGHGGIIYLPLRCECFIWHCFACSTNHIKCVDYYAVHPLSCIPNLHSIIQVVKHQSEAIRQVTSLFSFSCPYMDRLHLCMDRCEIDSTNLEKYSEVTMIFFLKSTFSMMEPLQTASTPILSPASFHPPPGQASPAPLPLLNGHTPPLHLWIQLSFVCLFYLFSAFNALTFPCRDTRKQSPFFNNEYV